MIWWWIGYVVIGLIFAGWNCKNFNDGREVSLDVVTGLCWPLIIVMALVWAFVAMVSAAKVETVKWWNKGKTK